MAADAIHFGMQIDGAERDGGRTETLVDPSTASAIGTVAVGGADDVDTAVESARRAFAGWADTMPVERGRALMRIAAAIRAEAEQLAEYVMRNTGHPRAF